MDFIDYFKELDQIIVGIVLKIYSFILFFFGFEPLNREGFFKSIGRGFRSIGGAISKGVRTAAGAVVSAATKFANYMAKVGRAIMEKIFKPLARWLKKTILGNITKLVTAPVNAIKKGFNVIKKGIMQAVNFLKEIPKHILAFFKRLAKFFKNLGIALYHSIIKPIFDALASFGTIFVGLFQCLMVIIQKIIDIPKCIIVYAYYGSIGFYNTIGKKMIPGWLRFIIETSIYILKMTYTVFYYLVLYPLMFINNILTGEDGDKILKSYWEGNCMTINFRKPLDTMKKGFYGLIPKFKPLRLRF